MNNLDKLAKAYERIIRVKRIKDRIKYALNHPTPFEVGHVLFVLNYRIYEIQGEDDRRFSSPQECVFYRNSFFD